jgi:hypothetical protein
MQSLLKCGKKGSDYTVCAVQDMKYIPPFRDWDLGFESRSRQGYALYVCISNVLVFSCSGFARGSSPVQGDFSIIRKSDGFRLLLNGNRPEGLICQRRRRRWNKKKKSKKFAHK